MMKTLLSTCLLLGLLSPVTSVKCVSCIENSTSCKETSTEICQDHYTCSSAALHTNIVSQYETSTFQGCITAAFCRSGEYSVSTAKGKFLQLKHSCCRIDECNKEPVHLTAHEDLSLNGLECPACFNITHHLNQFGCPRQGKIRCLANQTQCINFSSRMTYHSQTNLLKIKVCANEEMCDLDGKRIAYDELLLFKIKAKCWSAPKSPEDKRPPLY